MQDQVWQRRECVSAQIEESLVLLDIETLVYHSLNKTAAAVWEVLAKPLSAADITVALCERYDITRDHCRASVDGLITQLVEKHLVSPFAELPAVVAIPAA